MAWNPITASEIASGKPVKYYSIGQKMKDCLDYLYGVLGTLSSMGIPNGSFEIDSDSNDIPDNWTRSLYPGGTGGMAGAPNAAHGEYSYYFTHPGGVGCGGGYLTSDYIECTEYDVTYYISLLLWATAAMKNMILVYYYDSDKVELISGSPETLHSSTTNSATPERLIYQFTPPAGARYFKICIVGGYTDTNVAGTMRFDDVQVGEAIADDARMMAASISQSKLKTATGSVSALGESVNLTLPGGEYGFYPQIKVSTGGSSNNVAYLAGAGYQEETYTTNIHLAPAADTMYAQQRYISASGKDHWIYLLTNKETGRIIASYEAPDHPSANTQALYTDIPHPFRSYDPAKHEIILADNSILEKITGRITRNRGILDIINRACVVDEAKSAEYDVRLIKKINEYPCDSFGGDFVSIMKTPQWAKIAIKADEIAIEQFAIEKLPEHIQYRKLYFDEKKLL